MRSVQPDKPKIAGRILHPLPSDFNKEVSSIPDIKKNVHHTSIANRTKYNKIKSFRQDRKLSKTENQKSGKPARLTTLQQIIQKYKPDKLKMPLIRCITQKNKTTEQIQCIQCPVVLLEVIYPLSNNSWFFANQKLVCFANQKTGMTWPMSIKIGICCWKSSCILMFES